MINRRNFLAGAAAVAAISPAAVQLASAAIPNADNIYVSVKENYGGWRFVTFSSEPIIDEASLKIWSGKFVNFADPANSKKFVGSVWLRSETKTIDEQIDAFFNCMKINVAKEAKAGPLVTFRNMIGKIKDKDKPEVKPEGFVNMSDLTISLEEGNNG